MKYISILALIFACQVGLNAQTKVKESSVPEVVRNNFTRMFPNTSVTQWELINGNYEAEYKDKNAVNSVLLSADGKFIEYEYSIASDELPLETRNYITTNFAGQKMGGMTRIKTVTGNVTYEVEVGDKDYLFDMNGVFIGEEKTTEKDSDEK